MVKLAKRVVNVKFAHIYTRFAFHSQLFLGSNTYLRPKPCLYPHELLYVMLCNSLPGILSQSHIRMILRQMKEAINWTDAWSSPDGTYWNSQGRVQGCVSVNDNSVLLSCLLTNFLDSHIFTPVFAMQTRPTGLYPRTHYKPVLAHQ